MSDFLDWGIRRDFLFTFTYVWRYRDRRHRSQLPREIVLTPKTIPIPRSRGRTTRQVESLIPTLAEYGLRTLSVVCTCCVSIIHPHQPPDPTKPDTPISGSKSVPNPSGPTPLLYALPGVAVGGCSATVSFRPSDPLVSERGSRVVSTGCTSGVSEATPCSFSCSCDTTGVVSTDFNGYDGTHSLGVPSSRPGVGVEIPDASTG